jgi:hypothetical protein
MKTSVAVAIAKIFRTFMIHSIASSHRFAVRFNLRHHYGHFGLQDFDFRTAWTISLANSHDEVFPVPASSENGHRPMLARKIYKPECPNRRRAMFIDVAPSKSM